MRRRRVINFPLEGPVTLIDLCRCIRIAVASVTAQDFRDAFKAADDEEDEEQLWRELEALLIIRGDVCVRS